MSDGVEWRQLDFQRSLDFDAAVRGCAAVIHLAAEIYVVDRMQRVNVQATQALAQASERAGVKLFCYTSSIAVYGSGRQRLITENSPVLTQDMERVLGRRLAAKLRSHKAAGRVGHRPDGSDG